MQPTMQSVLWAILNSDEFNTIIRIAHELTKTASDAQSYLYIYKQIIVDAISPQIVGEPR